MGQKVNYNQKKTNKVKIAIAVILSLCAILLVAKSLKDALQSVKQEQEIPNQVATMQYNVNSYDSISNLLAAHNCKLVRQSEENGRIVLEVSFSVNLYTDDTSNENYFFNLCKSVAEFVNYKNFELKDTTKDIDIEVICDKPNIVEFKINGDVNYYLNHDSERFAKNRENAITNFTIQSSELQAVIDSGWDDTKVNFGSKESTCEGYQIYFEEGIKYKVVARNIFNMVFTQNYTGLVAGGLNVNSSASQVESALGRPTFSDGDRVYGYVGENSYLFFDFSDKQISVYPVVNIANEEEESLKEFVNKMNESNDVKEFATDLTSLWIDYDVYDFDSNYVDLRYTLRGVQLDISSSSLKNGIYIYQNYLGDVNISNLENVYLTNTDFVFEAEKERVSNEYLNRHIEGEMEEEEDDDVTSDFLIKFSRFDGNLCVGPIFYSKTQEFPDSELDKNLAVSSYRWYDKSKVIYSVNNDGIYVYNCETLVNAKIIEVEGDVAITSVGNGQIIYNNNEVINVEIN